MTYAGYEIVSASDPQLNERVKRLIRDRHAFIIRADRSFRYSKQLVRTLRYNYEGIKDAGSWTMYWSAFRSGEVLQCQEIATAYCNYSWRYELTSEGVDLIFDPPAGEASQGNNRLKNAAD